MMGLLLWQLFATFFIIGLFNFGGGGAMLSLIQAEVVHNHAWITEQAFTDIVAISQSTPGPIGINCATYVGYQVMHDAGYGNLLAVLGSASTTLALVLPSFILFFAIIKVFNRFHDLPVFVSVMTGLKPVVAGMIGAAALILILRINFGWNSLDISIISENFPDWKAWTMFAASFLLAYTKKVGPIALLLAAGVIGLLVY